MLAIELPEDIDARLERLARKTGKSRADYVREALLQCLDDWEDVGPGQMTNPWRRLLKSWGTPS